MCMKGLVPSSRLVRLFFFEALSIRGRCKLASIVGTASSPIAWRYLLWRQAIVRRPPFGLRAPLLFYCEVIGANGPGYDPRLEVKRKLSRPGPHMRTDVFQTTEPHTDVRSNFDQLRSKRVQVCSPILGGWTPTALGRNALAACEFR